MKALRYFLLLPACFLLWDNIKAQVNTRSLDSLMTYLYEQELFTGNILVAARGQVVYRKSFGYANRETLAPLNDSSLFEIASVTKPFTALGILMLAEQKQLSLDDSLCKFLPQLPYQHVTLKHLLTHTSGVPDYMDLFDSTWDKKRVAFNGDVISQFARYRPPLYFQPGDHYE